MPVVTLITFDYSCPEDQLAAIVDEFADQVYPNTAGLTWKIFLSRPEEKRAGGVYLFRDAESAQSYLSGEYIQNLSQAPFLSNVSVETFSTLSEATARTGAPL